jgi:hypothetical protein
MPAGEAMTLATCDVCACIVPTTHDGKVARHDTVGVVVRARTGMRRRVCKGSGRLPRRVER